MDISPMILNDPLENKPTSGKPVAGGAFESSPCRPAAKIMIESKARIPVAMRIIFPVFPTIKLPTIPAAPAITIRLRAAQPNQRSMVVVMDIPIADACAWCRYTESSALTAVSMASTDAFIVHHGNARVMKAMMHAIMPM